ncbi:hypothetical protein [Aureimonas leprariae]|uniref:Uncharacterized protein n=1 Tax=Plantimonas leprariae TaxID=2615207 RepID=A0A7V7TVF9_9HYPH|nr:hypothetical protein [Aureimonas leprariae]KAB0677799.1 hypothetical protein F6X38_17635 [Aureimonas leprariae]
MTGRSDKPARPAPVADWLGMAAAFAVVLAVVFGAGSEHRRIASGGVEIDGGSQQTASLLPARGAP